MVDERNFPEKLVDGTEVTLRAASGLDHSSEIGLARLPCPKCGLLVSPDTRFCPNDSTLIQSSDSARSVPNYQFIRLIGSGGMGNVYEAEHVVLKSRVAIKTLKSHLVETAAFLRFQQEAMAASRLKHPNIVSVYDCGISQQGEPYMIMDLIDGETLDAALKRKPLTLDETMRAFRQLCSGVSCAHENGILHRDLKPSNIILERHPSETVARVLDFGIAKILENDLVGMQQTRTGEIFGTPAYMSPEQAEGKRLDQRSDIYSMGCILYEMLTGQPPVIGRTAVEILYKHVNEKPLSLKEASMGKRFPNWLQELVDKCLARDPAQRFASVMEIIRAMDRGDGKSAVPDGAGANSSGATGIKTGGSKAVVLSVVILAVVVSIAAAYVVISGLNPGAVEADRQSTDERGKHALPVTQTEPKQIDDGGRDDTTENRRTGSHSAISNDLGESITALSTNVLTMPDGFSDQKNSKSASGKKTPSSTGGSSKTRSSNAAGKSPNTSNDDERVANAIAASISSGTHGHEPVVSEKDDGDKADAKFRAFLKKQNPKTLTMISGEDIPLAIQDDSLLLLKNFLNLTHIELSHHKYITNQGLKYVSALPELNVLFLNDTNFENESVVLLNKITRLKRLDLSNTDFTTAGITSLSGELPLKRLNLKNTHITNYALKNFRRFRKLEDLTLDGCKEIGDDGVSELKGLPLKTLSLRGTFVSDGVAPYLLKLPELTRLTISDCDRVHAALLSYLHDKKGVPKLEMLDVRKCPYIKEADIEMFQSNRPNLKILR